MAPTAAALLAAWEAGATQAPVDRAPSLLRSLGAVPADAALERLTVGQCDARLFRLRRAIFGDLFEAVATCSDCGADVELTASLAELQPPAMEGDVPPGTLEADGFTVAYRLPLGEDLSALAARGDEVSVSDLMERCVVDARAPGGALVTSRELPDAIADAVVAAMVASDPGAQVQLGVRCPCGREWLDELDIRLVVWTDLSDWVGRTLTEVHQLAKAYGWSEADILAMAPWRRRWYLEAAGW